jgi:hypothetical protein
MRLLLHVNLSVRLRRLKFFVDVICLRGWSYELLLASYATLINRKLFVPSARTQYVAVDKDHLVDFMKPTLSRISVDSNWYLQANPDVADAIAKGIVADARDHYVTYGYYEHRMPYEIIVDEAWYLVQYPDVGEAVAKGLLASGKEHFYAAGFKEGRLPQPSFTFKVVA